MRIIIVDNYENNGDDHDYSIDNDENNNEDIIIFITIVIFLS